MSAGAAPEAVLPGADLEGGWLAADISDPSVPQRLVDAAVERMGGLDILVCNAGGPPPGTFLNTELDAWDRGYQLTLMSTIRLIKAAMPHLQRSEQGRIVILTSTSVREPIPNIMLSNAFRSAVTATAKTMSGELIPMGITVNTIQPGRILTDRILELDGAVAKQEGISREAGHRPLGQGNPCRAASARSRSSALPAPSSAQPRQATSPDRTWPSTAGC